MAVDEGKIESLIRAGDLSKAWQLIKEVRPADLKRPQLIVFADFGRRVQQPFYTLKILGKVIRDHRDQVSEASIEEILSYVGALIKLGFYDESNLWLNPFSGDPRVMDQKARIQIAQWNYPSAVFYLKRFIPSLDPESYAWQVAMLNLSASLISSGQPEVARPLLRRLRGVSRKQKNRLILGNAWELQAQADLELKSYAAARSSLEKSFRLLGHSKSIWSFYVRKWNHVLDISEGQHSKDFLSANHQSLLMEADEQNYWEDLRDLDRVWAVHFEETSLAQKVYFGTYYPHYKRQMLKQMEFERPERYLFPVVRAGESPEILFQQQKYLQPGSIPDLLFSILKQDRYRPLSLGHTFSRLHPGEYFDPMHSPQRMASSVQALRRHLQGSGVDVHWSLSSGIQLKFQKSLFLPMQNSQTLKSTEDLRLSEIRETFGKRWFQRQQLETQFDMSERSAQRWLKKAENLYKLEVQGQGRARRYRFQ